MSLVFKKAFRNNLNNVKVFYEDNSLRSADFFRISYLPEVLTKGKNMLKLSAHPFNLAPDTEIKIDIRDANDNPIYFEIPDFLEQDKSRIISIWIYDDRGDLNTANGDATITLLATARNDENGNPVSKEFKNKPNIRWTYKVSVDRNRENITPIIFNPKSLPSLTPSESIETYTIIPTGSNSNSITQTTLTGSLASYIYKGNTPIVELNDSSSFNDEMKGYDLTLFDFKEPATPLTKYQTPINNTEYTASVSTLLTDKRVILEKPFTTQFENRTDLIHTYDNITDASYSISYYSTQSNVEMTSSLTSFITLEIDELEPITGVVDRLKIFIKSLAFPDSDFELINDIKIAYTGSLKIKSQLKDSHPNDPKIIKLEYLNSVGEISRTTSLSDIFVYVGGNSRRVFIEAIEDITTFTNDSGSTTINGPIIIHSGSEGETAISDGSGTFTNDSGSTTINGPVIIISSSYGEFTVDNLLLTASSAGNIITFTKGNGSVFDIAIDTGSFANGYIQNIEYETGSLSFDGINGAYNGIQNISPLTASSITTASINSNIITFTKGDGSSFPITLDSITDISEFNSFTASIYNFTSSYYNDSSSFNSSITDLENWSSSIDYISSNQTGSWVDANITGSSLITASVNLNTITFEKGDGTLFPITIDTGSAVDISSLNQFTASYYIDSASFEGGLTDLEIWSSSFTETQALKDVLLIGPETLGNDIVITDNDVIDFRGNNVSNMIFLGGEDIAYGNGVYSLRDFNTVAFTSGSGLSETKLIQLRDLGSGKADLTIGSNTGVDGELTMWNNYNSITHKIESLISNRTVYLPDSDINWTGSLDGQVMGYSLPLNKWQPTTIPVTDLSDLNQFTASYYIDSASFSSSINDLENWSSSIEYITPAQTESFVRDDGTTPFLAPQGGLPATQSYHLVTLGQMENILDPPCVMGDWTYVNVEASSWFAITETQSGRLVAVARTGINRVMYSDDEGETWTGVLVEKSNWNSIIETQNGRLVAVADGGTNRVMYSDDEGETWTYVNVEASSWRAITETQSGRLVAVARAGTNQVMYSDNEGETWTYVTVDGTNWTSIIETQNGRLVANSITHTFPVMYSDDGGDNWVYVYTVVSGLEAITETQSGRLVAVARAGTNRVIYSDNEGETWTGVLVENSYWNSIIETQNGRLVAIAHGGTGINRVMYSDDEGETWTGVLVENSYWRSITETQSGRLVAVSEYGDEQAMYSDTICPPKYVKDDGSVPFLAPQQGIEGTGSNDLVINSQLNDVANLSLVTASAILNEITFTKGDGSTFPVIIDTGSATDISSLNQFTASYYIDSASFSSSINDLENWSSSLLITDTTYTAGTGLDLTGTIFSHKTGSGWNHIPTGGSISQILGWDSTGKAKWASLPFIPKVIGDLTNVNAPFATSGSVLIGDGSNWNVEKMSLQKAWEGGRRIYFGSGNWNFSYNGSFFGSQTAGGRVVLNADTGSLVGPLYIQPDVHDNKSFEFQNYQFHVSRRSEIIIWDDFPTSQIPFGSGAVLTQISAYSSSFGGVADSAYKVRIYGDARVDGILSFNSTTAGIRNNLGSMQYKNTTGIWTDFNSITGSNTTYTAGTGLDLTGTTFSHKTGTGWNHIPTGGSISQILGWDSTGKAKWINETAPDLAPYTLVDGTKKFTGIQKGQDPVEADDLTTMGWVKALVNPPCSMDWINGLPQYFSGFSITEINGRLVSVGQGNVKNIMYSDDKGETWSFVSVQSSSWTSITSINNRLVAVAGYGTNRVMYSDDEGETWNYVNVGSDGWASITSINNRLVAVAGYGTNQVMYSDDEGETWNYVSVEASYWQTITSINNRLVAVASGGANRVMYSDDEGETWNYVNVEESEWASITEINNRLVAVGAGGANRVMYSDDAGETWNYVSVEASIWYSIASINNRLVALALSGTNQVMYSDDEGETWNYVSVATAQWRSITSINNRLVAVGAGSTQIMYADFTCPPKPILDDGSVPMQAPLTGVDAIDPLHYVTLQQINVISSGSLNSIVTASIAGDSITFTKGDSSTFDIEVVQDKHYTHTQAMPAATWNVAHGLNKYPSISIVTTSGDIVEGDVKHIDINNATLNFSSAFAGSAYLN